MLASLVAAVLIAAPAPVTAAAPADATAEALRTSLVEEERALLASQEERGRVAANLKRLAEQKRDVQATLDALAQDRARITARLDELRAAQLALAEETARRREQAGKRIALLARRSTARPLELLLTSAGPGDFVYRYLALQEIVRAERDLIVAAQKSSERLIEAQLRLDAELRAAQELEDDFRTSAARIGALEQLEREQFEALEAEADERKLWLAAIREEAGRLGGLVKGLQGSGAARAAPAGALPVSGELVAAFGRPDPLVGNLLPSDGWRFRAAAGTPVVAVAAGKAVYADWFQGYGYLVILDHGAGVTSLYAHLAAPAVALGADVLAGETVGAAGASGTVTEPGLYFEVRRDGKPIDPEGWLHARAKSRKGSASH